jgi:hypothetical protein
VIVDADGLGLAVHTCGANERDDRIAPATMERLPRIVDRWGQIRKPAILQGDRAYGFPDVILWVLSLLIQPLLAVRGSEHGSGLGKTRYVVERSLAWVNQNRRLRLCYEKRADHFQAFHELALCVHLAKRLAKVRRSKTKGRRRKRAKLRF